MADPIENKNFIYIRNGNILCFQHKCRKSTAIKIQDGEVEVVDGKMMEELKQI